MPSSAFFTFKLFCSTFLATLIVLLSSHSNAFTITTPRNHVSAFHLLKERQTTRLYYDNDVGSFNVTDSGQKVSEGKDSIVRTSETLAKRIAHRGLAIAYRQFRLLQQLKLREQQEKLEEEQDKIKKQEASSSMSTSVERHHGKVSESANPKSKSPQTAKENLELKWSIDKNTEDCDLEDMLSCSEPCTTCRGEGIRRCHFCNGHGYVDFGAQNPGTIGKRMEKNNGGHTGIECPLCDDNGDQSCRDCNGSGWIAPWRKPNGDEKK
jgi:hypothetical protein